jgi:hypothetical protein
VRSRAPKERRDAGLEKHDLGLRAVPCELSESELQAFCTFSAAERAVATR